MIRGNNGRFAAIEASFALITYLGLNTGKACQTGDLVKAAGFAKRTQVIMQRSSLALLLRGFLSHA